MKLRVSFLARISAAESVSILVFDISAIWFNFRVTYNNKIKRSGIVQKVFKIKFCSGIPQKLFIWKKSAGKNTNSYFDDTNRIMTALKSKCSNQTLKALSPSFAQVK